MDGRTESLVRRGHLTCHCLLIELGSELVLVDTGLSLRDAAEPGRLSAFFLSLLSPDFREEMTAIGQIRRMGFDPRDVRHIVLTHLDFDHAGGLDDFPHATVHMLDSERDNAFAQKTWLDRQRFRPQQWSTKQNWRVYPPTAGGDDWFGFERVRPLDGLPPEVAMVPLVGHTHGHCGVAVNRGDKWLLQAGDAYFFHAEMNVDKPSCTPGLRFYQWMMQKNGAARVQNQRRLRELRRTRDGEVEIFCGHDVLEFERLSGRSASVPANKMSSATRASRDIGLQHSHA